jgi:hypothetical protein
LTRITSHVTAIKKTRTAQPNHVMAETTLAMVASRRPGASQYL